MIVREMLGPFVMEAAGLALAAVVKDAERARHAEMHQQDFAGREIGEQILGAAAEAFDGLALEPLHEILRQRPAQIGTPRQHMIETRALKRGLKPAAHRFDFGKFGHALTFLSPAR